MNDARTDSGDEETIILMDEPKYAVISFSGSTGKDEDLIKVLVPWKLGGEVQDFSDMLESSGLDEIKRGYKALVRDFNKHGAFEDPVIREGFTKIAESYYVAIERERTRRYGEWLQQQPESAAVPHLAAKLKREEEVYGVRADMRAKPTSPAAVALAEVSRIEAVSRKDPPAETDKLVPEENAIGDFRNVSPADYRMPVEVIDVCPDTAAVDEVPPEEAKCVPMVSAPTSNLQAGQEGGDGWTVRDHLWNALIKMTSGCSAADGWTAGDHLWEAVIRLTGRANTSRD